MSERHPSPSETVHDLKTWPDYFDAILRGTKTFEVRREVDRYFHIGDTLRLREWHPNSETYTGRSIDVAVTHIFRGAAAFLAEFPPRVAVLGIRPIGQPMGQGSTGAEIVIVEGQRDRYRDALRDIVEFAYSASRAREVARQALAEIGQPTEHPSPELLSLAQRAAVAREARKSEDEGEWAERLAASVPTGDEGTRRRTSDVSPAHCPYCPHCHPRTANGLTAEELRTEVHRWRHCVSYWLGHMALTASPEECRAEGMRRAIEEDHEDRMAKIRVIVEEAIRKGYLHSQAWIEVRDLCTPHPLPQEKK